MIERIELDKLYELHRYYKERATNPDYHLMETVRRRYVLLTCALADLIAIREEQAKPKRRKVPAFTMVRYEP